MERRSAVLLVFLSRQPKLLLPLLSAALLIGGLALPTAYGVPLLLVLAVLVGWLSYLSWRVVPTAARVLRVVTVGLLLAAVVGRLPR